MKEIRYCQNPTCNREYILNHPSKKFCSDSCRKKAHRIKKGQGEYPEFITDKGYIGKKRINLVQKPSYHISPPNKVFSTIGNIVLHQSVLPAINRSIGGGAVGAICNALIQGSLAPLLKKFMSTGFKFHSLDSDLAILKANLAYWEDEKVRAVSGEFPIYSLAGASTGGLVGELAKGSKEGKGAALIGSFVGGAIGAFFDYQNGIKRKAAAQQIITSADTYIAEIKAQIQVYESDLGVLDVMKKEGLITGDNKSSFKLTARAKREITSADEYRSLNIDKIEFEGAYKYLLGKPPTKFYKIVTGAPGNGKSTYAVNFANYFQKYHGNVLYFPAEQPNKNADFQSMLDRMDARGFSIMTNMDGITVDKIKEFAKSFDLLVFDSVNYMKLTSNDLKEIRKVCAIVAVMQSTKDGSFKGAQDFKHDCDIFVELDEARTVHQMKSRSSEKSSIPLDELIEIDLRKYPKKFIGTKRLALPQTK